MNSSNVRIKTPMEDELNAVQTHKSCGATHVLAGGTIHKIDKWVEYVKLNSEKEQRLYADCFGTESDLKSEIAYIKALKQD